ncbi:MAG: hypothetical protein WKG07_05720 [Hymenobacter sp.]
MALVLEAKDAADAVRAGQRLALRPGRSRVDPRPDKGEQLAREIESGRRVRQRPGEIHDRAALRRREEIRLRPRAFAPRHPRVREPEVGVDWQGGGRGKTGVGFTAIFGGRPGSPTSGSPTLFVKLCLAFVLLVLLALPRRGVASRADELDELNQALAQRAVF